jgi:hypothetical protein
MMTDVLGKKIDFSNYAIKLSPKKHDKPEDGMCVMECVSYIQGEKFSDEPKCADPVVTRFAQRLNDFCTETTRQDLIPFIMRIAGSKDPYPGTSQGKRVYIALNHALRKFIPFRLGFLDMNLAAAALRALPEFKDPVDVQHALLVVENIELRLLSCIKPNSGYSTFMSGTYAYLKLLTLEMLKLTRESPNFYEMDDISLVVYAVFNSLPVSNQDHNSAYFLKHHRFEMTQMYFSLLDEMLKLTDNKSEMKANGLLFEEMEAITNGRFELLPA